jgi:hypothetical protein
MEFPPQSDPEIIKAIFHGKTPKSRSDESYEREEAKMIKEMSSGSSQ